VTAPWLKDVQGDEVPPLVESDAKTIRVVAGPGTGKTFGLVRRVQRVLHPEGLAVPGDQVLVVAFNRVIAQDLKRQIGRALGESDHEGEPIIATIHGLSLSKLGGNLRLLLPDERRSMLYDIRIEFPQLTTQYGNISKIEQALRDHEARIQDAPALWQAVRRWLIRHKAELISQVPNILLDRIVGGDFSGDSYRHVLVDEFQDLTPAEQELVLKLRHPEGSLVALGDPRQSIYAFRGNEREGLAKLDDRLAGESEPIADIPMTVCMRCPEGVVRAANRLMTLSGAEAMHPGSSVPTDTHVVTWGTKQNEAKGMAQAVVANVRRYPDERHLVMVTRRQFGRLFREAVAEIDRDLPIHLSFTEFILDEATVREAFVFFCLLADPDPPTWRAWLGMPIDRVGNPKPSTERNADAYLKFLQSSTDHVTETEIGRLASATSVAGKGGRALQNRALRYVDLKASLDWDGRAVDLIDRVLDGGEQFGITDSDKAIAAEDLESLRQKAIEVLAEQPDDDLDESRCQNVARALRHHVATKEPFVSGNETGVTISTLWGAKGVTAENVYVMGLFDEAMPGTRSNSYPGTDLEHYEEQRRLFYVSITRTKRTLVLSRPLRMRKEDAGPLRITLNPGGPRWWSNLTMCRFFSDIRVELPEAVDGAAWNGCA